MWGILIHDHRRIYAGPAFAAASACIRFEMGASNFGSLVDYRVRGCILEYSLTLNHSHARAHIQMFRRRLAAGIPFDRQDSENPSG